jgi:pimeloyl-ACP methyl ester carboxylesterase
MSMKVSWTAVLAAFLACPDLASPAQDRDALVDVGNHRLHLTCAGAGIPTVVLEAGLGSSSRVWNRVTPLVAPFTRVCSYDRPRKGSSDPAPRDVRRVGARRYIALRPAQSFVDDLRAVIQGSGEQGPFVLVGHSFGGLLAVLYSHQHPADVAGMVLVDSAHPGGAVANNYPADCARGRTG